MSKEKVSFHLTDTTESERPSEWDLIGDYDNGGRITLDRITKMTILGVCGWSLIETPLEIGAWNLKTGLLALAVSKLILILAGAGVIARIPIARLIFALICGASVLAIAPALPFVYMRSAEIATLSTVECFMKAACLGALCLSSFQKKPRKQRMGTVDPGMQQGRSRSDDVIKEA